MTMTVLVVGGGGREHALVAALAEAPSRPAVHCAPGNPGIAALAPCHPVAADDVDSLASLAQALTADLVVVGPELPLTLGLADRLRQVDIAVCGPDAAAARLEGSKSFTKEFCRRHAIPTADYAIFDDPTEARAYVERKGAPIVIKADGLAAGKGVVVAQTPSEALSAIDAAMVEGAFGGAGTKIVVEAFMTGKEASLFALCDGTNALLLGSAHDYKRIGEGDTGPNTGGMGAVSPTPRLTPALEAQVMADIIEPTVAGMKAEGTPFVGVLYAGLMLTPDGPRLVEYNVRFGDPECQVLVPRLAGDLAALLHAAATGGLEATSVRWRDEAAVCVVMAAKGYPGAYVKGTPIGGLYGLSGQQGITVYHAGTRHLPDGQLVADGGRVLGVTALAPTVAEARKRAYAAIDQIDWPEAVWRSDIAGPEETQTQTPPTPGGG